MSKDPKHEFLNSLLNQEQPLSTETYEEYQTMLSNKLEEAEKKVKSARRITIAVWITVAVSGILAGVIGTLDNSRELPQPVIMVGFVAMVSYMVCFLYGLYRVVVYLAVERRGPQKVQQEIQQTILLELTRKVDAISQRLDQMDPSAS